MLRFGMIGTGIISTSHLKALDKNPRTQIMAVADIDRNKARQAVLGYGASVYGDYKEMLQKEELDAVIINLPHYLHEESTISCAEKGIHILVEKPMAVSSFACDAMIRACKKSGVILQVGHIQRYFPENKKAKEIIDSGALGKLLMINDVRTSLYFAENRPGWFLDKERSGGGILMNLGAHSLDKIKFLTGSRFIQVSGACGFGNKEYSVEGNVQMFLRTESEVTACVTLCGYHDIPVHETTLYFSGGVLRLSTGKSLEIWEDGKFKELVRSDSVTPFEEQIEDFVQSILGGPSPVTDGSYAKDIIALIEDIYQKAGEINENKK